MKSFRILLTLAILLAATEVSTARVFGKRRPALDRNPESRPTSERSGSANVRSPSPQELQLIRIIREQQRLHVRESSGEQDWQCFSDFDYQLFTQHNVPGEVVAKLKDDPQFKRLVDEIGQMDAGQRSQLLARAARTYKPTWAQLGRISREGQTNAGQRAERDIAQAIVGLVRQMVSQPPR